MTTRILILAAICASTLAGCGGTLARVSANDQMAPTSAAAAPHHGRHGGAGMVQQLGLTAEQQASLKALMEKARTSAGAPDATARERFHALWTAPSVDAAALKALIQEQQAAGAKARDARVASLVEARNILTAEQRAKVADLIEARTGKARPERANHRPHAQPASTLTAEQQAQLKALGEKRRAGGQRMQAFVAFARTGDAAALGAAMASPDLADDLVALAGSLSVEQRTQLERRVQMLAGFGGGPRRFHKPGNHRK
ncbi:MAG: Heavy-metal resistance [Cyanobacteria bacterium RYN_339]|nr:Heavy-metal resistance [Cyanobacteria bacterium RYN_339]